jgi:transposase
MLGVDEVSYASEHRFLTCVADHVAGGVVWAAPGRNAQALQGFFAELTDEQKASIQAVSIDMSAGDEKAIRAAVPDARVAFDPFHVVQLGGKAADQVRRDEYNRHGRSSTGEGRWIKGARYSLLKDPANQTNRQLRKLAEVVTTNKSMYRAFLLIGELRYLYRLPKDEAAAPRRVARMGIPPEAQTVRQARPHDPHSQAGRTRRDPAEHQQRTP